MREIVIAPGNKGKLLEVETFFSGTPFKIIGMKDVPNLGDVEEPETNFETNAIIKAMTVGKRTGKLTLADDSGLEVDALGGEPGVKTARYASGTDEDRWRKRLSVMEEVPDDKRSGRFRCVIAIYDPECNDKLRLCAGTMEVRIVRKPMGTRGFGYDPIIFNIAAGKMHGEESAEARNKTSHRGKALARAKEVLMQEYLK